MVAESHTTALADPCVQKHLWSCFSFISRGWDLSDVEHLVIYSGMRRCPLPSHPNPIHWCVPTKNGGLVCSAKEVSHLTPRRTSFGCFFFSLPTVKEVSKYWESHQTLIRPSGWRYRASQSQTRRVKNCFYPTAVILWITASSHRTIHLLNIEMWRWKCAIHYIVMECVCKGLHSVFVFYCWLYYCFFYCLLLVSIK